MTLKRKYRTRSLLVIAGLAVAGQVFQPARTNPVVDPARTLSAHVAVPADVKAVLDRSCRDCHSNETVWPWYSRVSPASWLVVGHVNDGRRHMNFSDWLQASRHEPGERLEHICEEVRDGEMPLTSYTLLHPSAKLSDDDVRTVCAWTDVARAGRTGADVPGAPAHGH